MKHLKRILIILAIMLCLGGVMLACSEEQPAITITFETNGGSAVDPIIVRLGGVPQMPPDPTKEGYTFAGWFIDNETFNTKFEPKDFASMQMFSNVLYAKWVDSNAGENPWTVSFNTKGGTAVQNIYKKNNDEIEEAPTSERSGYFFEGWSTSESLEDVVEFPYKVVANITFYARWSASCTVSFITNLGSAVEPVKVRVYGKITEPAPPTRSGYEFWAWYTESAFINQWNFDYHTVSGDMVLYARWESQSENLAKVKTVKGAVVTESRITLVVPNDTQSLSLSDRVIVTANCIWSTSTDSSGLFFVPNNIVTDLVDGNNIFYIKVVNQNNSTFNVHELVIYRNRLIQLDFNLNYYSSDTAVVEQSGSYEENVNLTAPPEPTRSGFRFGGWFYERICITEFNFNLPLTVKESSLTLYARWVSEKIHIRFNYNYTPVPTGSKVDSTVDYGTDYQWHVPTRKGYKFGGWWGTQETIGSQLIFKDQLTDSEGKSLSIWDRKGASVYIIYAKWVPEVYTISYNNVVMDDFPDGTVLTTEFIITTIVTLPIPSREGYTFDGWYKNDKLAPIDKVTSIPLGTSQNMTLFAKWTPRSYRITYQLNSQDTFLTPITASTTGTNHPENPAAIDYNSGQIILKDPTRPGFVFDGWYIVDGQDYIERDIIPEKATTDYIYYAKWLVAEYTITYHLGENGQNDSANPTSINITITTSFLLANPTRDGYTFDGWYISDNFIDTNRVLRIDPNQSTHLKNLDIYAKWTARKYSVVYNDIAGITNSPLASKEVTFGNTFELPIPRKTDSDFVGWFSLAGATGVQLTGINGVGLTTWNVVPAVITATKIDIYAGWTAKKYAITLNTKDGVLDSGENNVVLTHNAPTFTLEVPTRMGYIFEGWWLNEIYGNEANRMTDKEGNSVLGKGFTLNQNMTFFAKWTAKTYEVQLNASGGTIDGVESKTVEVTFGVENTLGVPIREGFKQFFGWTDENGNNYSDDQGLATWIIDSGMVLYADWYANDYIPIASEEQLRAIGENEQTLKARYYLVRDIVLSGEWTTLGEFNGILNGNGYSIHNMRIVSFTNGMAGMFSINRGLIMNLSIENATIEISTNGLTVLNIGMLAAINYATIQDCFVEGEYDITASGMTVYAGSITGTNYSIVSSSIAQVNMSISTIGTANGVGVVGGIVGENRSEGTIKGVLYAAGNVTKNGQDYIITAGVISNNSYALDSRNSSGSVVGVNSGTLINVYAFNGIHFKFIGDNCLAENISYTTMSKHDFYRDNLSLETKYWNIMQSNTNANLTLDKLPMFIQNEEKSVYYMPRSAPEGTVGNPYLISSYIQLNALRNFPYYSARLNILSLNLSAITDWLPVGTLSQPYSGTFTSQNVNNSIQSLTITNPTQLKYLGLFGINTGTIQGFNLHNISVGSGGATAEHIGTLVGLNMGRVQGVTVSGENTLAYLTTTVTGSVGGLVGKNVGTIYRVRVERGASFYGYAPAIGLIRYIGGVAGENHGIINNAFSDVSIQATSTEENITSIYIGGIAGWNKGIIKNTYASADLHASVSAASIISIAAVGGLVGRNDGQVSNSYTQNSYYYPTSALKTTLVSQGIISAIGGIAGTNGEGGTISRVIVLQTNFSQNGGTKYLNTIVGRNEATTAAITNVFYDSNLIFGALEYNTAVIKTGSAKVASGLDSIFFSGLFEISEQKEWSFSAIQPSSGIYARLISFVL